MGDPAARSELPADEVDAFDVVAREAVEWIAGYLREPGAHPVLSRALPGDVAAVLPSAPPSRPEQLDRLLQDFREIVVPGTTHWNHPGFMAYFGTSATPAGILGELLASALNVNAMLWRTSPAATEIEQVTLDWLRQLLGLPDGFAGILTDTASMSTFLAMAAAREVAVPDGRRAGLAGRPELPTLVAYASEEAHSSVEKAAIALGIGAANLRRVPTDEAFRLRPDMLAGMIDEDLGRGRRPFACVATVGTTSTTSIDPVPAIADVCAAKGLWLHVDGAYGAAAAVALEHRAVLAGCDRADSIVVNPHKWLMTPMDASALYLRDLQCLRRAFSLVPEYLRTPEGDAGQVMDLMDYGLQLGRRFRALKLWFVMRAHGADGLAEHIRSGCRLARALAGWVSAAPGWRLMAPVPLSTVCLRYEGEPGAADAEELDRINARVLERVNRSGEVMLSHTRLRGRLAIRVAVGNARTEERHVARAWSLLQAAAASESGMGGR